MKKLRLLMVTILWSIGSVSCTSSVQIMERAKDLFSTPIPVPRFLFHVAPPPGARVISPQFVCISINQGEVWETGNQADELSKQLIQSTQIMIDGLVVDGSDIVFQDSMDLISRPTGSHSGFLDACTKQEFEKGIHLVTMSVKTLSNKNLTYSWAFEIV